MIEARITVDIPALDRIATALEKSAGVTTSAGAASTPAASGGKTEEKKTDKKEITIEELTVLAKEYIELTSAKDLRKVLDAAGLATNVTITKAEKKFYPKILKGITDAIAAKKAEGEGGADDDVL